MGGRPTGSQGTFKCGVLVSRIGGSGDPRRKWEEMGERERERERERGRVCVKKCCFCLQNVLKNLRNARSVYIASQKAWRLLSAVSLCLFVFVKKIEISPLNRI